MRSLLLAVLLCFAASLNAQPINDRRSSNSTPGEKQTLVDSNQAVSELRGIRSAIEANGRNSFSEVEKNYAQADLKAQELSAKWTAYTGIAAILGVVVSVVGVALVFGTFRQTLRQAREFDKSLQESTRTANAMQSVAESMATNANKVIESVDHQRIFGRMQMRAYVSVIIGQGRYQDDHFLFESRPQVINSGHTPAKNVRWRIAMDILPNPLPNGFRFPLPKEVRGGSDLPPHQDGFMTAIYDTRLEPAQADIVKYGLGHVSMYVWGIVWYRDVFGEKHHTSFAQRVWWEPATDKDGKVDWAHRGQYLQRHNQAT